MIPLPVHALLQAPDLGEPSFGWFVVFSIVKIIVVFTVIMVGVALLTLAERKISAWIQDRHGPNRVGPSGLLQPAADGLKNIMKEETLPAQAYTPIFMLAPMLAFIPALLTFSVIPFAAPLPTSIGNLGQIDMVVADMPVGFLFITAIASLGVYGITLAGWSSNNKYALLGGLRASAQMVSYEVAMGLALLSVLLMSGNVNLNVIVAQQQHLGWNVLPLLLGFFVFLVSGFAETNRLPFDMPEAESELIAGYHTEYSAMKFSMFFIAEYSNMVTVSALTATLFFGGWSVPSFGIDALAALNHAPWAWYKTVLTLVAFGIKVLFFLFVFMWVRWTLPRFRYDQLMALGWKVLLPLALAYVVVLSGVMLLLQFLGVTSTLQWWILGALNIVLAAGVFVGLDRGRLVHGASPRLSAAEVARLRDARARAAQSAMLGRAPRWTMES
ncbi:MAG TPA: NADH-quinone oxidoreductase subunit NuoH [Gemmatimonadaceae bacterium]|nr:NADH-quinone oxidoreductase subunit NuoH [Gemmatimonadaceae bacterium]